MAVMSLDRDDLLTCYMQAMLWRMRCMGMRIGIP